MTYKALDAQLSKLKLLHRFEAGAWDKSSSLSEEGLLSVTAARCTLWRPCLIPVSIRF